MAQERLQMQHVHHRRYPADLSAEKVSRLAVGLLQGLDELRLGTLIQCTLLQDKGRGCCYDFAFNYSSGFYNQYIILVPI